MTNYAVQKKSHDYTFSGAGSDSEGSKWSVQALRRYLCSVMKADDEAMWSSVKDLIVRTLCAVATSINADHEEAKIRANCFEIYGFDILLDESLKPWLIEVNCNPDMHTDTPLDYRVKWNLSVDTLNMIGVTHESVSGRHKASRDESRAEQEYVDAMIEAFDRAGPKRGAFKNIRSSVWAKQCRQPASSPRQVVLDNLIQTHKCWTQCPAVAMCQPRSDRTGTGGDAEHGGGRLDLFARGRGCAQKLPP